MLFFRMLSKAISWTTGKLCHWYVAIVLLLVGACYCIASPFFEQTKSQRFRAWAEKIPDMQFQKDLSQIDNEKQRAVMQLTFQAYDNVYGSAAWAKNFVDDLNRENRRPRFSDIVEVAIGIDSAEDRERFLSEHMDVYSMCLKSGAAELAHKYSELLSALKELGGQSWLVAQKYPVAAFVYGALKDRSDLWEWYVRNAPWCTRYLMSLVPEGDATGVVEFVKTLRVNQEALKLVHSEIESKTDEEIRELDLGDGQSFSKMECYAAAFSFVAEFGDVLRPLARAKAPMLISFNVLSQNMDAFKLDTAEDRRLAGERLAVIWSQRDTSPVWYQASLPSGIGVIRLYEKVPQYASKVIGLFGECYVARFLLDEKYYGANDALLTAATYAISEWEEPGWAVLMRFKESDEFKELLVRKDIGVKVVPYVLNKGPNDAIAQLFDDPRWADRYFNADGSLKKDKKHICEALPLVGGITSAVGNWAKGYPCTMEEIGWAAFDVIDIGLTFASFGISKAGTEVLKQGGKQAVKESIKQGGKSVSKTIVKKGGKLILHSSAKTASEKLSLKILWGVGRGLAVGGNWTVRLAGGTVKAVALPVGYMYKAWQSMPPAIRKGAIRTAACVMFGIAIWNRTLKLLPGIIHDSIKEAITVIVDANKAIASGVVDGLKSAIVGLVNNSKVGESLGFSKMIHWFVGALCIFFMGMILVKRSRFGHAVEK